MYGKIINPDFLGPEELDHYLSLGWFRMGQSIFTCHALHFNETFYSAIWLRLQLEDYETDNQHRKLSQLNRKFRKEIGPAQLTPEKERLFEKYRESLTFETAESLTSLLNENYYPSPFDTWEVTLYDGEKLIGIGLFDKGLKSAAGIVSVYDPDYKKYSLGKYLIYSKIEYCKSEGFRFFYPGYFAPGYPLFDYKLSIGKAHLHFFDLKHQAWLSMQGFDSSNDLVKNAYYQTYYLFQYVLREGLQVSFWKYEYYNSNSVPFLEGLDLFDYPYFLFVSSPSKPNYTPIVVFDIVEEKYKIVQCISMSHHPDYQGPEGYYGTHLLKIQQIVKEKASPKGIVEWLLGLE